jgi:prolipoprotein diacylglyceryltransferase
MVGSQAVVKTGLALLRVARFLDQCLFGLLVTTHWTTPTTEVAAILEVAVKIKG